MEVDQVLQDVISLAEEEEDNEVENKLEKVIVNSIENHYLQPSYQKENHEDGFPRDLLWPDNRSFLWKPTLSLLDLQQYPRIPGCTALELELAETKEKGKEEEKGFSEIPIDIRQVPRTWDSETFVRGSSQNVPFSPGGSHKSKFLEEKTDDIDSTPVDVIDWVQMFAHKNLLSNLPIDKIKMKTNDFEIDYSNDDDDNNTNNDDISGNIKEKTSLSLNFDDIFSQETTKVEEKETTKVEEKETTKVEEKETTKVEEKETTKVEEKEKTKVEEKEKEKEKEVIEEETNNLLEEETKDNIISSDSDSGKITCLDWAIHESRNMDNFEELVKEPAITYPFELDVFQKQAIYHLEQHDYTFVSAHTSAGKTVVAEYAIAMAAKHLTRTIYTSPIKALSNQKFRDFKNRFDQVGIITGDVSVNPEAGCLIVTTEVLRSMLYGGADLIRDVEWVIFDEVHYINDIDRGVVWEEVIILLPAHIKLIFLSATVPNALEFANWIGKTKREKVYVVSTSFRPVPLEHYIWKNGIMHKIVSKTREFLRQNYRKAINLNDQMNNNQMGNQSGEFKKDMNKNLKKFNKYRRYKSITPPWVKFVRFCEKCSLLPVVAFTFSKKKCEEFANIMGAIDLVRDSHSKSAIQVFITNSLSRLRIEDQNLPQIIRIHHLLLRGIGVHHGGLLPLVKELVEILFSRGFVKILFATETFAMGVNMPARTVVFSNLRKHDGINFRGLLPGEYTQMSGRAGRRGIDDAGSVIILCTQDIPEASVLSSTILGSPTRLTSQFRLSYNMLLSLLRMDSFRMEDMMKKSFSEFAIQRFSEVHTEKLKLAEIAIRKEEIALENEKCVCMMVKGKRKNIDPSDTKESSQIDDSQIGDSQIDDSQIADYNTYYSRSDVDCYFELLQTRKYLVQKLQIEIELSGKSSKFLKPGVLLLCKHIDFNANVTYENDGALEIKMSTHLVKKELVIYLRSNILEGSKKNDPSNVSYHVLRRKKTSSSSSECSLVAVDIPLSSVWGIVCSHKLPNVIWDRLESDAKTKKIVQKQLASFDMDTIKCYHPLKDMKINTLNVVQIFTRLDDIKQQKRRLSCHKCPKIDNHMYNISRYETLLAEIREHQRVLSNDSLQLMPEFTQRMSVLTRLQYIDPERKILLIKGRVCREINTCDELLATEMIFDGFLNKLEPSEMVSILSCFVFEEKVENDIKLPKSLEEARINLLNLAVNLADVQTDCGLKVSHQDAKNGLHFGLMEVVYEWAKQTSFGEICTLTDVLEGSIVRCITRLSVVCREIKDAAIIMGNSILFEKAEEASRLIKRDIVFATSLYIS